MRFYYFSKHWWGWDQRNPLNPNSPPLGSWSSSKFPCWPQLLWRANPKPWRWTQGTWGTSGADPALCGFGLLPSRHSKTEEKSNLWRLERVETPVGLLSSSRSRLKVAVWALFIVSGATNASKGWLTSTTWGTFMLLNRIPSQFAVGPQCTHLPCCPYSNPWWNPLYNEFQEECWPLLRGQFTSASAETVPWPCQGWGGRANTPKHLHTLPWFTAPGLSIPSQEHCHDSLVFVHPWNKMGTWAKLSCVAWCRGGQAAPRVTCPARCEWLHCLAVCSSFCWATPLHDRPSTDYRERMDGSLRANALPDGEHLVVPLVPKMMMSHLWAATLQCSLMEQYFSDS